MVTLSLVVVLSAACAGDGTDPHALMGPLDGPSESAREGRPGSVADLAVISTSRNGATLHFTEVADGEGRPANYDIRYKQAPMGHGWGSATSVREGSCRVPLAGSAVGRSLTCSVEGLRPGTKYDFQLVPYRGTLNHDAVFGPLSEIASGTTRAISIQVEVRPSSATLEVGQSRQLRASVTDPDGNPVEEPISWSSTRTSVATVSGGGTAVTVRARDVGDTEIRATAAGATGTARIRVVQGEPAGGGSGSASHANEPSGFRSISERSYSTRDEQGWRDRGVSIVRDGEAPASPPSVGRMRFPAGFVDGRAPGTSRAPAFSYESVYSSFWFRLSPNWQGHDSNVNKIIYITDSSEGGGGDPVYLAAAGSGSGSLHFQVRIQNPNFRGRNLASNRASARIHRGRWHHIEVLLTMNTGNRANGEAHVWVDGRKTHEYRDVRFARAGSNQRFDNWRWGPVWGGNSGDVVRRDMYQYLDHVYLSGR